MHNGKTKANRRTQTDANLLLVFTFSARGAVSVIPFLSSFFRAYRITTVAIKLLTSFPSMALSLALAAKVKAPPVGSDGPDDKTLYQVSVDSSYEKVIPAKFYEQITRVLCFAPPSRLHRARGAYKVAVFKFCIIIFKTLALRNAATSF